MKSEEIKFLKELQHELLTQDKLCQADPRFWVIRDYRWVIIPTDYADEYRVYDNEGTNWTLNQFADYIKDEECYDEILEELDLTDSNELDFDDIENIVESINKYYDSYEYEIQGVNCESFIVPNTMFLTNREAKEHLKSNHYHYTSKAHTYSYQIYQKDQK